MRTLKSILVALFLIFVVGDTSVWAESMVASLSVPSSDSEKAPVPEEAEWVEADAAVHETEAVLSNQDVLIQATAELVSRVGELRTALEVLRLEISAQSISAKAANEMAANTSGKSALDACFSCSLKSEWAVLPLGSLAPFSIKGGLCETGSECISATRFKERAFAALSRPLSGIQRMSCDFLLRQLGSKATCPSSVGEFYECSTAC